MSTMSYKGFAARVEYSPDDNAFVGHIAGINDIVGFHADTVAGLNTAFHEAVDDYVEACASAGKTPEKSFSGRVMFRIAPETHAAAARAAELAGVSLNEWAEQALREAASAAIIGRPAASIPDTSPLYALAQLFTPRQGQEVSTGTGKSIMSALAEALNGDQPAEAAKRAKSIFPDAATQGDASNRKPAPRTARAK